MESGAEVPLKPIVIAIIDSGIDTTKSDMSKYVMKSTGFRVSNGYIVEDEEMEVVNHHGTAIAMIIRHICKNVQFISINILDERLVTDGRVLICALEQALSYKPDIIHLSLGTTKWRYKFLLNRIIKAANKNNILIVAAANNQGLKSYPAYLKHVIGVKAEYFKDCKEFSLKGNFFYAFPCILRD